MNGSAVESRRDAVLAAKVDGIASALDGTLNSDKLVGAPRDGFILMIVPGEAGRPPRVSHYASSVHPLAVAHVLLDQLDKMRVSVGSRLDGVRCRFGCDAPVAGVYHVPEGCVCWDDPVQALCDQHLIKAQSAGPITAIATR